MNKTGMMEIALGNGIIEADAKTGMINLKSLEKVGNMFNGLSTEKDEGYKRLRDYLINKDTLKFIEVCNSKNLIAGIPAIETTGKNRYKKTWGNLYIAIDLAMWMSPEFKYEVIDIFINKKILDFRILGIDYHKELNDSIDKLPDRIIKNKSNKGCYINAAKLINEKCNGGKFVQGWDVSTATPEIQKYRSELIDFLVKAINMGMITSWEMLKESIKNL